MQKILIVSTRSYDITATVFDQNYHDSDYAHLNIYDVAALDLFSPPEMYKTVLSALADGWKLLGPPVGGVERWDWWLARED